jgi:hypothetical protein
MIRGSEDERLAARRCWPRRTSGQPAAEVCGGRAVCREHQRQQAGTECAGDYGVAQELAVGRTRAQPVGSCRFSLCTGAQQHRVGRRQPCRAHEAAAAPTRLVVTTGRPPAPRFKPAMQLVVTYDPTIFSIPPSFSCHAEQFSI